VYVGIDPQGGLLATIDHKRSSDELLAALGSEHAYTVVLALDALHTKEGRPTDAERTVIARILTDPDEAVAWRKKAAEILGAWRDDSSVAILLGELEVELGRVRAGGHRHAVRAAIVGALGTGVVRDEVVAALKGVIARDPNEHVRAGAVRALGRLQEIRARSVALTALQASTHSRAVERAGAELLGRHGLVSDLKALARHRTPNTDRGLLHAAMWASVRIANREPVGPERERAREPVARDAERLLTSLDLRTRQQARAILGEIGDRRSIAALETAKRVETDPDLIGPISDAIDSIRKRKDTDQDPTEGELTARLEEMEERLEAAEALLKELEERR
jgi:HEAT repeat protein